MDAKPEWMQQWNAQKDEVKEEPDVERIWAKPQHRKRNTDAAKAQHYEKKKQKFRDDPELRAMKREKERARKARRARGEAPAATPPVLRANPAKPANMRNFGQEAGPNDSNLDVWSCLFLRSALIDS